MESISIRAKPFSIDAQVPSSCIIGEYIDYKIKINNDTINLHKFELNFEENEQFFISGYCKQIFDVLPKSLKELTWTAMAIKTGKTKLPNCSIKCISFEGQIIYSESKLIYVFPYQIDQL